MKSSPKAVRINAYVSDMIAKEVARERKFRRGATQSSIVEAALRERYNPLQENLSKSLLKAAQKLRNDVNRIERVNDFTLSALSGFIRLWLCYNPSLPEDERKPAELSAARRFKKFVELVFNDSTIEDLMSVPSAGQENQSEE